MRYALLLGQLMFYLVKFHLSAVKAGSVFLGESVQVCARLYARTCLYPII